MTKGRGTNITLYIDSETLAWLDQICGVLGTTRGKAITTILKQMHDITSNIMRLGTADSTVVEIFRQMLRSSV